MLNIDLFTTRFNWQLPVYISLVPDPQTMIMDTLAITWEGLDAYAYPPPILISGVLQRFQEFHCCLLLITQRWPNQLWSPDLLYLADPNQLPLPDWDQFLLHPLSKHTIWIWDCSNCTHYLQATKEEGVFHCIFSSHPVGPSNVYQDGLQYEMVLLEEED